jgi:pyrimidine operon attenuation protein/uracil phosphoribosyltransferase
MQRSEQAVVLGRADMRRTLVRVAHEIVERNPGEDLALVGIHRRGAVLARRLHALVGEVLASEQAGRQGGALQRPRGASRRPADGQGLPLGFLDISFYRDDLATRPSAPVVHATELDFSVDGRTVVIVDDVLYTGRTVRAAIDEIFDYGRPACLQLAVLIDRGHRELPIRPDYVGKNLPTSRRERVNVCVEEIDGLEQVAIVPADARVRSVA